MVRSSRRKVLGTKAMSAGKAFETPRTFVGLLGEPGTPVSAIRPFDASETSLGKRPTACKNRLLFSSSASLNRVLTLGAYYCWVTRASPPKSSPTIGVSKAHVESHRYNYPLVFISLQAWVITLLVL